MSRRNRRITTGPLNWEPFQDLDSVRREAYWAKETLTINGRRIYHVPYGIIWLDPEGV